MAATERITVYVTSNDKKRLYAAAKAKGEHASEFAKRVLLSHLAGIGPVRKPMRSDN